MSAHGTVVLFWKDREDTFCLAKIGQQLDLEERCRSGIGAIMTRLIEGTWGIRDVRETIRLGLIGGGMDARRAQEVVEESCVAPLQECALTAMAIISAIMVPPHGDQPGKAEADRAAPEFPSTKTEGSADSLSTLSEPVSTGTPAP